MRNRWTFSLVLLALFAGCGVSEDGEGEQVIDNGLPETGTIVINGMPVPKEKLLVVIHIGHSNMAGRAIWPVELRPYFFDTDPKLWAYHWEDPVTGKGPMRFRPAKEPLSADPFTMGFAGPGMALLRGVAAMAPDAQVVSIGRGHSGRDLGACVSFRKGGLLYDIVMGPARQLKDRATIVGVFTMFGATEFEAMRTPAGFGDCLKQVAADMRADLALPDLPFMIGDYEAGATGAYSPVNPDPMQVIAEIKRAATEIPRAAIIPTDDIPIHDDHHFNLQGHKDWADRALRIIKEKGWATWATAP
jgi:hypothetical protein